MSPPAPPRLNKSYSIIDSRSKDLPTDRYSYKLGASGGYGLDVLLNDPLDIDELKMSVRFPFVDGNARDNVGDIVRIQGLDLSRHQKNPIIGLEHFKHSPLPIATAEDPETGYYAIELDPIAKIGWATGWFYQGRGMANIDKNQEHEHANLCAQIFDMLAKRFLRAASVGYTVIHAEQLPIDYASGIPAGLDLQNILMLECSIVTIPANAATVRKSFPSDDAFAAWQDDICCLLGNGKCCGKTISPVLTKSLEPYKIPRKEQISMPSETKSTGVRVGQTVTWNGEQWEVLNKDDGADEATIVSLKDPDKGMVVTIRNGQVVGKKNMKSHPGACHCGGTCDKCKEGKSMEVQTKAGYQELAEKLHTELWKMGRKPTLGDVLTWLNDNRIKPEENPRELANEYVYGKSLNKGFHGNVGKYRIETNNTALGWVGYVVDPTKGQSGLVATARARDADGDEVNGFKTENEAVEAARQIAQTKSLPTREYLNANAEPRPFVPPPKTGHERQVQRELADSAASNPENLLVSDEGSEPGPVVSAAFSWAKVKSIRERMRKGKKAMSRKGKGVGTNDRHYQMLEEDGWSDKPKIASHEAGVLLSNLLYGDPSDIEHAKRRIEQLLGQKAMSALRSGAGAELVGMKDQPSDSITPEKAREMLKNPPHGKPLTEKQERMMQAAAHKNDKAIGSCPAIVDGKRCMLQYGHPGPHDTTGYGKQLSPLTPIPEVHAAQRQYRGRVRQHAAEGAVNAGNLKGLRAKYRKAAKKSTFTGDEGWWKEEENEAGHKGYDQRAEDLKTGDMIDQGRVASVSQDMGMVRIELEGGKVLMLKPGGFVQVKSLCRKCGKSLASKSIDAVRFDWSDNPVGNPGAENDDKRIFHVVENGGERTVTFGEMTSMVGRGEAERLRQMAIRKGTGRWHAASESYAPNAREYAGKGIPPNPLSTNFAAFAERWDAAGAGERQAWLNQAGAPESLAGRDFGQLPRLEQAQLLRALAAGKSLKALGEWSGWAIKDPKTGRYWEGNSWRTGTMQAETHRTKQEAEAINQRDGLGGTIIYIDEGDDVGAKSLPVKIKAQKYRTETMPWDKLRPGMLVESPGGFDYLVSVEKTPDGRRKVNYQNQQSMTVSEGNWLDVPVENLLTGERLKAWRSDPSWMPETVRKDIPPDVQKKIDKLYENINDGVDVQASQMVLDQLEQKYGLRKSYPVKSLPDIRMKYRAVKRYRRTIKKSVPGSVGFSIREKDLDAVKAEAKSSGCKASWTGDGGGLVRVKLTGADEAMGAIAKKFSRKR